MTSFARLALAVAASAFTAAPLLAAPAPRDNPAAGLSLAKARTSAKVGKAEQLAGGGIVVAIIAAAAVVAGIIIVADDDDSN